MTFTVQNRYNTYGFSGSKVCHVHALHTEHAWHDHSPQGSVKCGMRYNIPIIFGISETCMRQAQLFVLC